MSAAYVRATYRVDYKVGERLVMNGLAGTLVSFPDQYLGIRFDGERRTSLCHPTWRVRRETPLTPQTPAARPRPSGRRRDGDPRQPRTESRSTGRGSPTKTSRSPASPHSRTGLTNY